MAAFKHIPVWFAAGWLIGSGLVLGALLVLLPAGSSTRQAPAKHVYAFMSPTKQRRFRVVSPSPVVWPRPPHHISPLPALALGPMTTLQPLCNGTVLNVVAHEDDDLLFINPAINSAIHAGACVRTVFLTTGDDGQGAHYSTQREYGSRAAYSEMLGGTSWTATHLNLGSQGTVTAATSGSFHQITLLFLRLPDGNLNGSGFAGSQYQSLAALRAGRISSIQNQNGRTYTSKSLVDLLTALISYYNPISINTQANDSNESIADHSDHIATGQFVTDATKAFYHAPIHYYEGYPIRGLPSNISAANAHEKATSFFMYAARDAKVCGSFNQCDSEGSGYTSYLSRQYEGHN